MPTTSSTVYSGPVIVSANETLSAIAVNGSATSVVGSAVYQIAAPAPSFAPIAGTYTIPPSVTISDSAAGATNYYTTNGTTPNSSSSVYSGPITTSGTGAETIEAIAIATGYAQSGVGSAIYRTRVATPTFAPATGTYTGAQLVAISDTTTDATIYYTTNGTTPTTASAVYSAPIPVSADETLRAIAVASGDVTSLVGAATYAIDAAKPSFLPLGGTYTAPQSVTISDTSSGAIIYYTTNGATPTTSSTVYSGPIAVSSNTTLKAVAASGGYSTGAVATATYGIRLSTPTFTPAGGTYGSAQPVTISDVNATATIYYTTDGTIPTTSSNVYSTAVTVGANETLKAIAVESGYANSFVGTASYKIR